MPRQGAPELFDVDASPQSRAEINDALRRILTSDQFSRSERLTRFLTYVVEKALQGQAGDLKEYRIGVDVCGRKNSYDPRTDPVVRVEARRLRSALALYYAQEGSEDTLQIAIPKGAYVPSFSCRKAPDAALAQGAEPIPEVQPDEAAVSAQKASSGGKSRKLVWALALALLVVAAGGLAWRLYSPRPADASTLVLAAFTNTTGDPIFDRTLRQGLASQLEESPYLSLLSDAQTAQTLALMDKEKDARLTVDLAREVCERNGKAAVIDGSISTLGSHYIVGLRAIACHTGEILALEQTEAQDKEHVLTAMAQGAAALRRKLGESLSSVQKYDAPPESVTTPSLEALQAYSLGFQVHVIKLDEAAAADLFRRAIALDPNFAMAYARAAVCEINLGDLDKAADDLRKAYELREHVSDREGMFILSLYQEFVTGNLDEARKTYELRAQVYPHDDIPIGDAGNLYYMLGQYDKALEATQEAIRRNPGSRIWNGNLVSSYLALQRLPEAKAAAEAARTHQLDSPWLHLCLYLIAYVQGNAQQMAQEASQLKGTAGFEDTLLYYQAQAAAKAGRLNESRALSQRAVAMATSEEQPDSASLYLAQAALNDAWVGNQAQVRQQAHKALQTSSNSAEEAVAAVALAMVGDSTEALRIAADLSKRFPESTIIRDQYVPTIRAAAALHGNAPAENPKAILKELQAASLTEFGSHTIERVAFLTCYSIYFRGETYLAAHQGVLAAAEFRKILDHPQLTLTDPVGAMATLALARAYELSGDHAQSAAAYKSFLSLWNYADANLQASLLAKGIGRIPFPLQQGGRTRVSQGAL